MENEAGASSSSTDFSAPLSIMPPPPTSSVTNLIENDGTQASGGIDVPSNVRNLRDIMKYSTEMTNVSDDSVIDLTLCDEKKNFFTNVLSSMTVNVQEEMHNSINILLDSNKTANELEYAFDVLAEYIDNIDYANDFQKLGGFQIFIPGLKSEHKSVRCKTAEVIATLVQNNPYCQDKFIEHPSYIRLLISLIEKDTIDEVRVKGLHAISSLVRDNVAVFWKFIGFSGNDLVVNALKSSNEKLMIKAAFLIYSTCLMGNDIANMYVDNGVVEIICSIIMNMKNSLEDYHHELLLSTLNQLLQMSPIRVKEICFKVEDFKPALLALHDSYPNDSNYQDEKDEIVCLMKNLNI
ncbi:Armadillo-type fold,Armadillo-like helical,Nucleotide exchange factor Fes1 [Cinara cedri]|uniref:Armadillo-type fold,Armadillo-like helical,Nucleotide exchange factor Fes1 n=1 Tax=Cinara cedri TaxID=506608 RepID=A0A5E4NKE5_9HEMI|nr:Armadillo-type fold,Armadillo-like helical,Nucleotide exchange factor Fes1 [Cinara cedri]